MKDLCCAMLLMFVACIIIENCHSPKNIGVGKIYKLDTVINGNKISYSSYPNPVVIIIDKDTLETR